MKEFEKLLFEDFKRQECEKALLEVELGLFEQKEETTFDLSVYTQMSSKKYKRLYDLYRHNETGELVYVCALVENNEGAEDERKDMTPYAYDVLYLEYLDEETYEKVKKAGVHETSKVPTLYVASWVLYIVNAVIALSMILYTIFTSSSTLLNTLMSALYTVQSNINAAIVATPLLAILSIKYKSYKEEK